MDAGLGALPPAGPGRSPGLFSPNQDARADGVPIDMLVLHYTGMRSAAAAIERLCDPVAAVSSHYVVEEDGTLWQLVAEERRAFHAGISFWRGHTALNPRSIGIEIVNPGHEFGYRPFPPAQMRAVLALCQGIIARHPIPPRNVVAHSDIAPNRKQDPGELFDWAFLAANGIGIWPTTGAGAAYADLDLITVLTRIGYDPALPESVAAFQRHWRQSRVDGAPDDETTNTARAVLAAIEGLTPS
jgi:N-acetylmuramoyl-L-alanine amidase